MIIKKFSILFLMAILMFFSTELDAENVDFDLEGWQLIYGEIVDHLGRKAFTGSAYLKDLEFRNGTIKVDIAVTGARSYPGITFRMQSPENYESFYIRPHRAGLYPDALQYTPVFNRQGCWQLYNGKGYTAFADIPTGRWLHLKIEILGTRARVFLNNSAEPALVIDDLKHGDISGTIGVSAPLNRSAFFSNFKYSKKASSKFPDKPKTEPPAHMLTRWEISKAFPAGKMDIAAIPYPRFFQLFNFQWKKVKAEDTGLINISRYTDRTGRAPDCVFARTVISSDKKQTIKLSFGYSDEVSIFHNGKKVFYGNSSYRYRDPSFLGIVGLYDTVYINLEKGLNEIFLAVKETFGGWGFMVQADGFLESPKKDHRRLEKIWETPPEFLTPESVCYDAKRDILYVSNFDSRFVMSATPDRYTGFISRVTLDGEIEQLRWVDGLHAPSGMAIYRGKLYVVERRSLVEIDIKKGVIINRYSIPNADFLNDIVADAQGNFYITDTTISKNAISRIFQFKKGKSQEWYSGEELNRPNGLFLDGNRLIVGNSGDCKLKSFSLKGKSIDTIINLGPWVMDGIGRTIQGDYLVSHWQGEVYLITSKGIVVELLETRLDKVNSADFEFIPKKNILIIPTYSANRVMAYRLLPGE